MIPVDPSLMLAATATLSQPACKLIDAVRSFVGTAYAPTRVRRLAKAERDAAITKAEGDAEVALIKAKGDVKALDVVERAKERLWKKEIRRQQNIESIVEKAIEELPEQVNEQKVDEDWTANFFEQCQDVEDEQMQSIWARLLAGEVARPGSYSPRTLSLIKGLRKDEAQLFSRFCSCVWRIFGELRPVFYEELEEVKNLGINFDNMMALQALGLIQYGGMTTFAVEFRIGLPVEVVPFYADYFGRAHVGQLKTADKTLDIGRALLTSVGRELAPIAGGEANEPYRAKVVERWQALGCEVQAVPVPNTPAA